MPTIPSPSLRYSVLPYLSRRMETRGRSLGFNAATRPAHKRWRRELIAKLKNITGFDTMVRGPLRPRITETKKCDGYTRQRIEIDAEPGIIMTLYALVPTNHGKGPFPAVMCPHGHASGGKFSPAGRRDIPGINETIEEYNYDYGVQYARAGLVAFCPDARGFGERQEPTVGVKAAPKDRLRMSSCQYINQMAYPLGQTVTGMWAWDMHRLVDYIQTRPDCIPDKIGCAGLSGGGLQTLWAAALDDQDRIKAAVVSGYFYGYRESLLEQHQNCSCNYVPHLYEYIDIGDLGALVAPRPMVIETGDKDDLNGRSGLKNVTSQVSIARKAYKLLGAGDALVHDIFKGGHRWNGKIAVPWMVEQLR